MTAKSDQLFIGIDVGTGSARAGVFDSTGEMLCSATVDIELWRPETDFVEQSSEDIWLAVSTCCKAVTTALDEAGLNPGRVAGIGFDATCSLVALDKEDRPVSVNIPGADPDTSATGMIVWSIRQGIECGLLHESKFAQSQQAGVRGILRFTDEDGRVSQSMADAAGIGRYPWLFGHTTWTQGFALLAAGGTEPLPQ